MFVIGAPRLGQVQMLQDVLAVIDGPSRWTLRFDTAGYFGEENKDKWKEHDASELLKQWKGPLDLLIDVVSLESSHIPCFATTG